MSYCRVFFIFDPVWVMPKFTLEYGQQTQGIASFSSDCCYFPYALGASLSNPVGNQHWLQKRGHGRYILYSVFEYVCISAWNVLMNPVQSNSVIFSKKYSVQMWFNYSLGNRQGAHSSQKTWKKTTHLQNFSSARPICIYTFLFLFICLQLKPEAWNMRDADLSNVNIIIIISLVTH